MSEDSAREPANRSWRRGILMGLASGLVAITCCVSPVVLALLGGVSDGAMRGGHAPHGRGLQRRPRATAANARRALAAVSRADSSIRTFFFSVSSGIVEKTSRSSSALSAV